MTSLADSAERLLTLARQARAAESEAELRRRGVIDPKSDAYAAHEARRGREMLNALEAFIPRARDLDWDIQAAVRPLAESALAAALASRDDGPSLAALATLLCLNLLWTAATGKAWL